jgi:hypothetical protein
MITEEVFVNCYNSNPITKVAKGNFKVSYKLSGAGAEPKETFSASQITTLVLRTGIKYHLR